MRIGTFGDEQTAVVQHDGSVDVTPLLGGRTLDGLIRDGIPVADLLAPADLARLPRLSTEELDWRPPLIRPGKIIGAPANYYDHVDEMPDSSTIVDWGLFLKAPSSVIGHRDTVRLPWSDKRTDHEGELAVVIGRTARGISPREAPAHVFGYTCLLDITVRSTEDRSLRKSFDTFTPIGPWITTADDIPDPGRLDLRCHVNGELRQHTSTGKMIYSVPHLIAYASAAMTLHPGDVIATGTPAGVGPLAHGDRVTVAVDRIGTLEVFVSDEDAILYHHRPGHKAA